MSPNTCPLCGKTNPPGEWACEACGARLPQAGQISPPNPAPSGPRIPPPAPPRASFFSNFAALPFLTLVGALASIIFGLSFAYSGYNGYRHSQQGTKWPTVEGQILESRVEQTGGRYRRRGGRYRGEFTPIVRYSYQVNGGVYEGSKLTSTDSSGSKVTMERKLMEYGVGTKVPVYYNPADPSDSLLEPGEQSNDLIRLITGLLMTAVGAVFAVGAFLGLRR